MLASVASTIDQFNMPNISLLQELGYEVEVACNFVHGSNCSDERIAQLKENLSEQNVRFHHIDFTRQVFNLKQEYIAYRQLKKLVGETSYDFIHCHTPIGGVIGRLVGHKHGVKVIYTAHGFHFYTGAPLLNWLLFYPIEKWLARYTDVLITINEEDYARAKSKFRAKSLKYIRGVGVDTSVFNPAAIDAAGKKQQLGIPEAAHVLLSVGELNNNKNHAVVMKALKEINNPDYHYVICGKGAKKEELGNLAEELGIADQVHLLGFRTDVAELYAMSDVFLFPSRREGLSVALMEAIASGVPAVVSNIRGNKDLVADGENGYLVAVDDVQGYAQKIRELIENPQKAKEMSEKGRARIKQFDIVPVTAEMKKIYQGMVTR